MAYPDDLGPTDAWVYHYTTAPTALEHILQDMRIRLGPVRDANDPWESRQHNVWVGKVREAADAATPPVIGAASLELEAALARARVACFSQDDRNETDPIRAQVFARSTCGWAQDRMWAQYADGHCGVCLAFDRDALLESFYSEFATHGQRFARAVEYGDELNERGSEMPSEEEAENLGPVAYAMAFRTKTAERRFFTKRLDWAGEREWRLVLFDDNPSGTHAFLPMRSALRAIIVGHRFADAYQPIVKAACERLGIPAFKLLYSGTVSLSGRYDQRVYRTR